jgi:hypothetical protein
MASALLGRRDLSESDVGPTQIPGRELLERRVHEGDLEAEALGEIGRDPPFEASGEVIDVVAVPEAGSRQIGGDGEHAVGRRRERPAC